MYWNLFAPRGSLALFSKQLFLRAWKNRLMSYSSSMDKDVYPVSTFTMAFPILVLCQVVLFLISCFTPYRRPALRSNLSVKRDCGTGVASQGSRFCAAAPYLQLFLNTKYKHPPTNKKTEPGSLKVRFFYINPKTLTSKACNALASGEHLLHPVA